MSFSWKRRAPFVVVTAMAVSTGSFPGAQAVDGEWRNYFGPATGTKYSTLSLINKDNVKDLRIAWRWRSADRALQLSNPLWRAGRNEETPLMINGQLYTVTGLGLVAALDPAMG